MIVPRRGASHALLLLAIAIGSAAILLAAAAMLGTQELNKAAAVQNVSSIKFETNDIAGSPGYDWQGDKDVLALIGQVHNAGAADVDSSGAPYYRVIRTSRPVAGNTIFLLSVTLGYQSGRYSLVRMGGIQNEETLQEYLSGYRGDPRFIFEQRLPDVFVQVQ